MRIRKSEPQPEIPNTAPLVKVQRRFLFMGAMKNYLLEIICEAAPDEQRGQDAIEHAITSGFIELTYSRDLDLAKIRAEWDQITECWDRMLHQVPELQEKYEYKNA